MPLRIWFRTATSTAMTPVLRSRPWINSHVALVSMLLRAEGFSPYRCDRNIALGINLVSLTKVLRAAQNEDILTLKAEDSPDAVNLMFESAETEPSQRVRPQAHGY